MLNLVVAFLLHVTPAWDANVEQTAIMAADSISWNCTTNAECERECVERGMPANLCSDWSYNSSQY